MKLVAGAWYEAFKDALGRADQQIDRPRMIKAFREVRRTFRKWPSPVEVIELMPRRPETKKLNYDPPADPETCKKVFEVIQDRIAGKITQEQANQRIMELQR